MGTVTELSLRQVIEAYSRDIELELGSDEITEMSVALCKALTEALLPAARSGSGKTTFEFYGNIYQMNINHQETLPGFGIGAD